jgi:hypothetical protein
VDAVHRGAAGLDDVQAGDGRLHRRTAATEGGVDGRMHALVEGAGALLLALPDVDVAQAAIREAAVGDAACAALRAEISTRRAANMRLFAADLRAPGELRPDLPDDEVADIVWSMNAAEYRALLVGERGWSAERFGAWLADAWTRLLLASPT